MGGKGAENIRVIPVTETERMDQLGIEAQGRSDSHQEPVGYVIDPSDPQQLNVVGKGVTDLHPASEEDLPSPEGFLPGDH